LFPRFLLLAESTRHRWRFLCPNSARFSVSRLPKVSSSGSHTRPASTYSSIIAIGKVRLQNSRRS